MEQRIFVTGLGIISGIGNDLRETLNSLFLSQSGIGRIQYIDTQLKNEFVVSEVKCSLEELFLLSGIPVQEGYSRNAGSLRQEGCLIWDADLVRTKKLAPGLTTYQIPATRFAEELGNIMMANIVMLGFLAAVHGLVSVEALREAVWTSVPKPTREINAQAFERGREYGEAILKSRAKKDKLKD